MNDNFVQYQTFDSLENARALLVDLLEQNNIAYEIANTRAEMDIITGRSSLANSIAVKIRPYDFKKVDELLDAEASEITEIPEGHFFIPYETEELIEVLHHPYDWDREDYVIAQRILEQRGRSFSSEQIDGFRKQQLEELAKPDRVSTAWLALGFLMALPGGIVPIIFGRILYSSKKSLPDGKKVFAYDIYTRNRGFIMFLTGIFCLVIYFVLFLLKTNSSWSRRF